MRQLVATRFARQAITVVAVFFGATLLLSGLVPPQEAHSQETKNQTAQSKSGSQEERKQQTTTQSEQKTAQSGQQEAEEQTDETPEESDDAQEEQLLDEDPKGKEVASGELLVSYKRGTSKEDKDKASKDAGGETKKDFPEIDVRLFSFKEVKNERAQEARQKALERKKGDLERNPDVQAVDYNYIREGSFIPNDPDYDEQWGYPKINSEEAWDSTQGNGSVKVAVLDSGVDANHEDLKGKMGGRIDYVNDDLDPWDDHGHGTHVSGTIAASTNNYTGVAGTCPNCSLLIAKVLDQNNKGSDDDLIDGINWAASNGTNVINMSLGGFPASSALEGAINNAWEKGIVLVASAGNNGTDGPESYPGAYPNVIAVAATDSNDKRAVYEWWSGSYCLTPTVTGQCVGASNAGEWVDVAAPGKYIYSTLPSKQEWWEAYPVAQYDSWSGTSMAAPHVSGLAGLLFSQGFISNSQVRNRIESTTVDLGTTGKDRLFGSGLIDAQAALDFTPLTYEEDSSSITYSGYWTSWTGFVSTWTRGYQSGASGLYVNYTDRSNAWASLNFTGSSITWWSKKSLFGYGRAHVYVDGSYAETVDLYSFNQGARRPVFTRSWPTSGDHTIEIVVEGTSGRPRVDVDAFTVLQPKNSPSTATDDSYTTNQDTTLDEPAPGVLANDADADNDPLTASKVSDPANGALTLNSDGSFSYTPNAGFSGTDSFTYEVSDGTNTSNTATVNITVQPAETPPEETPPTVISVNPTGTGVSRTANVTITFSEAMDTSTLNADTVKLTKGATSVPVEMQVSTDESGRTVLTLDPYGPSATQKLGRRTTYTVRVEGAADADGQAVKDAAGEELAEDFASTFKTKRR